MERQTIKGEKVPSLGLGTLQEAGGAEVVDRDGSGG